MTDSNVIGRSMKGESDTLRRFVIVICRLTILTVYHIFGTMLLDFHRHLQAGFLALSLPIDEACDLTR